MKTRYRILFFLIGIAGIVLLAVKAVPDGSDWGELFTPRLPLLLLGLLLLWAVIYAIHTAVYLLIMGKEAASAVGFPRMYRICISGFLFYIPKFLRKNPKDAPGFFPGFIRKHQPLQTGVRNRRLRNKPVKRKRDAVIYDVVAENTVPAGSINRKSSPFPVFKVQKALFPAAA